MYKAQTVAFFSLTLAALGLTGCYNNEKTTHTKENRLKTEFTEQEQQTLKNNMVAIHSTQNTEAIAQMVILLLLWAPTVFHLYMFWQKITRHVLVVKLILHS